MTQAFEISPASLAQVQATDRGKMVAIDDDVQNVAADLQAIDPGLKLFFNPSDEGGYFSIELHRELPNGSTQEELVTTAQELDQRLVERVRQIDSAGYSYADELDRADAAALRAHESHMHEKIGVAGEKLRHALKKDLGLGGNQAYISRGD